MILIVSGYIATLVIHNTHDNDYLVAKPNLYNSNTGLPIIRDKGACHGCLECLDFSLLISLNLNNGKLCIILKFDVMLNSLGSDGHSPLVRT